MTKQFLSLLFAAGLLMIFSCADENLSPILTFDKAGKGAYVRLLDETARDINLFDLAGSNYVYSVEFVDLEKGNLVSEYTLNLIFEDAEGGKSSGPTLFRSWSSGEFTSSPGGFKSVSGITITAAEVAAAAGISPEDIGPGDVFRFVGNITTTDGQSFGAANSSSAVNGSAFQGHFDYKLTAICPSSLAGTYDVVTTATWCGDNTPYNTSVTFTPDGKTAYDITDFSFGAYDVCYNDRVASEMGNLPLGNLRLVDVCNKLELSGSSQWGEIYTWSNFAVDGNTFSFDWVNDYGEGGSAQVIRTDGSSWPPLELK